MFLGSFSPNDWGGVIGSMAEKDQHGCAARSVLAVKALPVGPNGREQEDYDKTINVHQSLLNSVLHDQPTIRDSDDLT
jgi:hypothetical protein